MEEKKDAIISAQDEHQISPFSTNANFENAWRMGKCLSRSSIVPEQYQGDDNIPNCIIALELASRIKISPFLVMQNMDVISGRPSWRSQYLIGAINVSGRFSPLKWKIDKKGNKRKITYKEKVGWDQSSRKPIYKEKEAEIEDISCVACAQELATGDVLEGPEVSIEMAINEGWYGRDGSKWKTMPELMLRYRSAAFFCRMYCPEVAMGLRTADETEDIWDSNGNVQAPKRTANAIAKDLTEELTSLEEENVTEAQLVPPDRHDPVTEQHKNVTGQPQTVHENVINVNEQAKQAEKKSTPKTTGQVSMDFSGATPGDDAFEMPLGVDGEAEGGELF